MRSHFYINGSSVMISNFYPEYGHSPVAPAGFSIMLKVDDAVAWFARAVAAASPS